MIEIKNLRKIFPTQNGPVVALDGINLRIEAGEIYGIIGLSGAGKSTLIRCINMLEKPTEGQVIVDGQNFTSLNARQLREARRQIGMIFQHFNLLSSRTVFANVAFPLEIAGLPRQLIREKVSEMLELVGLSDKAHAYPSQLSGGQKQRVGIARALANDPKVLLCDEATSALDPRTTRSILHLLRDINEKLNLTIVLITHEMQVIKEICDKVAVIEDGKIVEEGPVIDIFTRPRSATTRKFINSIINTEIPEPIRTRFKNRTANGTAGKLIRISFIGETAKEPVISSMVQQCQVRANVLYGNIDHIKDTIFGTLTLELQGKDSEVEEALRFLKEKRLQLEVLSDV
ncbi:methionine ABC transporter ATP-binding protein [Calderihabitans maritimus]|uniref:Methionine import ATP-binding protein MetN n=1 Tax=Calderihabitans maritimus TaxID=1246530 RepID=A0A1Z5HSC9_9FIRM|nr:methionine ABC transporter ATP-binding protein [Calderihabitans maritimus]GAW92424.1 methionine import ATP-binding protein MetN [Calderihabitans maritimus]